MRQCTLVALILAGLCSAAHAGVIQFGDRDLCNTGSYGSSDPTAGATLQGLAANAVTFATNSYGHGFPFSPTAQDFSGTDQIYVGSNQTGFHDGYSSSGSRRAGPQTITLNYSSLVGVGQVVQSLTLGIAADDFQRPVFGQPFSGSINNSPNQVLTNTLNSLSQTGPRVQFFTIGISPSSLLSSHVLTLTINQGGDGGDGWAIDFLTVGVVTASAVPEPATVVGLAMGVVAGLGMMARKRRTASI